MPGCAHLADVVDAHVPLEAAAAREGVGEAAGPVVALEHQHLAAVQAGQQGGGGEAAHAGADDDHVGVVVRIARWRSWSFSGGAGVAPSRGSLPPRHGPRFARRDDLLAEPAILRGQPTGKHPFRREGRRAAVGVLSARMSELVTIGAAPAAKRPRWRNPYRALPAVRWGVQGLYLGVPPPRRLRVLALPRAGRRPGPGDGDAPALGRVLPPHQRARRPEALPPHRLLGPGPPGRPHHPRRRHRGRAPGPQGLLRLGLPGGDPLPRARVGGGEAPLAPPLAGRAALARPRAHCR